MVVMEMSRAVSSSRVMGSGVQESSSRAVAGGGGQAGDAGEDGVADAGGQRGVGLGEDLADVEGVAGGAVVHVGGVGSVPVEQRRRRLPAEGGELESVGVGGGDEVAEDGAEGVVGGEGVAVGQHQQQGQGGDAAGQESDQVQGGFVGPVQVFDDVHAGVGA